MYSGTLVAFILACWAAFALGLDTETCPTAASRCVRPQSFVARSCRDYYRQGYVKNGYYRISPLSQSSRTLAVYCDFESEPGAAWTLVESFALKKKDMPQFQKRPFREDAPVNENSPNWGLYRMSLAQMKDLRRESTHWRVTCNFMQYAGDIYNDYARANFTSFDITTYRAYRTCQTMEYVNVRRHECVDCTAMWTVRDSTTNDGQHAHIESDSRSYWTSCSLNADKGAVSKESNFGYYLNYNTKFRCSVGPESTTNWWFGGY